MKAKLLLITICFSIAGFSAEAQILKKLKEKVENTTEKVLLKKTEQKTEQVVENTIDSVANPQTKTNNKKGDNSAKLINTEAKRSFYTTDVIVRTSDSKGKGSEYYFDSDEIAARGVAPNSDKPIFIDSEGFQYGYNESERRWEKTGLMQSDAMSFMLPMMSTGILKLPAEPTLDASKKLKEQGLNMNTFQIVEWAFIYKPEHFRSEDFEETTAPCPNGGTCPKFLYTDPEYEGSWVLFDKQGRLAEVYANVNTQQTQGDGSYKFEYSPVTVDLPYAVEVKMPFQDLLMKGADVTPSNEKERIAGSASSGNPNSKSPSTNIPKEPVNKPGDSREISTLPDPDNPLSYIGVTVVLEAGGRIQTYRLDTQNWIQEIDYHGEEGLKPTYFDLNGLIYTHEPKKDRYLCADLKMMGKMFDKMFQNMLKSGDMGFTETDLKKYIGENEEVIEMIMNLYDNAPSDLQNAALFPIGNWPFIYGVFRTQIFENDKYEKTKNGEFISYSPKDDPGLKITYDNLKRPVFIQSEDGHVNIKYEKHNLRTPPCSEMLSGAGY